MLSLGRPGMGMLQGTESAGMMVISGVHQLRSRKTQTYNVERFRGHGSRPTCVLACLLAIPHGLIPKRAGLNEWAVCESPSTQAGPAAVGPIRNRNQGGGPRDSRRRKHCS
jgi:hypothetical protein